VTEARKRSQLVLIFIAMGVSASLLPAAIPSFSAAIQVAPSALISAVPAMFGGLLFSVAITPLAMSKLSEGLLTRLALGLISLGLVVAGLAQEPDVFILGAVLVGLGFGVAEVIGTSSAEKLASDTSSKLTQLNAAFALAALATPISFVVLGAVLGPRPAFLIMAILVFLFAVFNFGDSKLQQSKKTKVRFDLGVLLFAVAALCYVGSETLIAGWSSLLVNQIGGLQAEFAGIGGSAFWALFALGRVLSAFLTPKRLPVRSALVLWPAISSVCLLSAAFGWQADSSIPVLGAFAVATVAAGPCYALIIGHALDMHKAGNATALTSVLILSGSAGGFLFPLFAQAIGGYQIVAVLSGSGFLAALVLVVLGSFVSRNNRVTTEAL
jgi:fucose permease